VVLERNKPMRKLLVVLASLALPSAALACQDHDAQQAKQDTSAAPVMIAKAKAKKPASPKKPTPTKSEGKG
jgi:hypothetical protein